MSEKPPVSTATSKDKHTDFDPFLLERIYPEAANVFSAASIVDPRKECIIVLDTNALLLPYNVGKDDLSQLFEVYNIIAETGRLFIPERVAREFIKNRDRKLADMVQAIGDIKSKINTGEAIISPLLERLSENEDLKLASQELQQARKSYNKALDSLTRQIKSWRGNDPITPLYKDLFTTHRLIRPAVGNQELQESWQWRLQHKVPPGYKDANKGDLGIGDFIIWMSLLAIGAQLKKDLIFVTGEEKADWFVRGNSEGIYPRPELIDEYRRISGGKSLVLSSLHDLLRGMKASDDLIKEVEAAEIQANTAISSASSDITLDAVNANANASNYFHVMIDLAVENGIVHLSHVQGDFMLKFSSGYAGVVMMDALLEAADVAFVPSTSMTSPFSIQWQKAQQQGMFLKKDDGFLVRHSNGSILAARVDEITGGLLHVRHINFRYMLYAPWQYIFMPR